MNFTREPIIETVITPREGCKLVVRSSKGVTQEDYFVDAVEVVSFGHSLFFRSQERPRPFLVPVSDYEVLELKETRMALKNVTSDRSIKISGGREAPPPQRPRENGNGEPPQPVDDELAESRPAPERPERPMGKRDKRRRGRRGRDRDRYEPQQQQAPEPREPLQNDGDGYQPPEDHQPTGESELYAEAEAPKAPSFISKLFPPPPTLIKESLSRYKVTESTDAVTFSEEKERFEETIFEHPDLPQKDREDDNEE